MILQHADVKRGPSAWKQPLTWDEFSGSWGTFEAVGPVRPISGGRCCCSWGGGARSTALHTRHPARAATFCLKKTNQQQRPCVYMGNLPRAPNDFGWVLLARQCTQQDLCHRRCGRHPQNTHTRIRGHTLCWGKSPIQLICHLLQCLNSASLSRLSSLCKMFCVSWEDYCSGNLLDSLLCSHTWTFPPPLPSPLIYSASA